MNKRMTSEALSSALVRAQQGHPDAKQQLFAKLIAISNSMVKSRFKLAFEKDPSNAVGQIVEYAFKSSKTWLDRYEETPHPERYIYRVIYYSALRVHRDMSAQKRTYDPRFDSEADLHIDAYNEHQTDDQMQDIFGEDGTLIQFMKTLTGKKREIFQRRFLDEDPTKIIARDMDLTEDNVDKIYSRVRDHAIAFIQKNYLGICLLILLPILCTMSWLNA